MQEWRKLGTGDYEVNRLGEIRRATASINTKEGRLKKPCRSSNGYMIVGCFSNGKRTNVLVHRAVAEAFIGPCPDGCQVNHKDGNKCNNYLDNLEYVTVSGNMVHAIANGLHVLPVKRATGDAHWTRKNPEKLKRGDDNPSRSKPETLYRGEQCHASKLKENDIIDIRKLFSAGFSMAQIAEKYAVSRRNISEIVRLKSWKHVT